MSRSSSRSPDARASEPTKTLEIHVFLPSGCSKGLSIPSNSTVRDLKAAAREFVGSSFFQIIFGDGQRLCSEKETLEEIGLRNSDAVTAIRQTPQIAANPGAFATWYPGSGVATWVCQV